MDLYLIESLEHSKDGVRYWMHRDGMSYTRDSSEAACLTYAVAKNLVDCFLEGSHRMWDADRVANGEVGEVQILVLIDREKERNFDRPNFI